MGTQLRYCWESRCWPSYVDRPNTTGLVFLTQQASTGQQPLHTCRMGLVGLAPMYCGMGLVGLALMYYGTSFRGPSLHTMEPSLIEPAHTYYGMRMLCKALAWLVNPLMLRFSCKRGMESFYFQQAISSAHWNKGPKGTPGNRK